MNSEQNGLTGWVLAGVATSFATLSSVVAFLFKLRENENAKAILKLETSLQEVSDKAEKCETDRHLLFTSCEVLKIKLDVLEKRVCSIDSNGTDFARKHEGSR
jgi:hypothetical protein